ncbi:MAG TPA: hypothetical protein VGI84_01510, partial [Pseudonocardiaceae bacterium]
MPRNWPPRRSADDNEGIRVAGREPEIPPLTWDTALTTWIAAPIADALAAVLLAGYLWAVFRLSRTG